ncbi:MAG: hypothetical protein CVT65_04035 [Actinobacteria bacterium HGW-Actinobacteria-5]|jgi:hypothetical protein|nr:MAG: hypothetical protein CVT65_04035 [Actinobacteria bacterium HGW-Actinobacteria-5]
MSNPLEPSDVGPAAGGDLTASDTDRDHVIALLTAAQAEGRLTAAERDQRIAAARTAETFDDLVPLTRDLVSPTGPAARPVMNYDESHGSEEADQIVAIFGGATRKHRWKVRRNTSILAMFGGVELDLTEATFEAHELTFNVFCLFGGVEVTVPPGTDVDSSVIAVFGGTEVRKLAPPDGVAPRIVVKGFCGFGGVEVRNPKDRKRS